MVICWIFLIWRITILQINEIVNGGITNQPIRLKRKRKKSLLNITFDYLYWS